MIGAVTEDPRRAVVGREAELLEIDGALDRAGTGHGQLLLLSGEPGVGKTRLCDEAAARAGARGVPVLWGRAWEAGGAPAYWPWIEVLGGLAGALDDEALRGALGEGTALLAELIPSVPGPPRRVARDGDAQRRRGTLPPGPRRERAGAPRERAGRRAHRPRGPARRRRAVAVAVLGGTVVVPGPRRLDWADLTFS